MEKNSHPGLDAHRIENEFHCLRIEGGKMVMAGSYPCRKRSGSTDLGRMDGSAESDHPVDDFREETADDHDLAGCIVAGHKRGYKASCGHSAKTSSLLENHSAGTVSSRSNGCTYSGRTSADNKDIDAPDFLFSFFGRTAGSRYSTKSSKGNSTGYSRSASS